jgi:hypothetical protein
MVSQGSPPFRAILAEGGEQSADRWEFPNRSAMAMIFPAPKSAIRARGWSTICRIRQGALAAIDVNGTADVTAASYDAAGSLASFVSGSSITNSFLY